MICPAIVSLVLTALSPAAWNLRNRLRISLWSAFSITIASDDMLLLSARWKRGGYPAGQTPNASAGIAGGGPHRQPPTASADRPGAATYRQPRRAVPGARRPAVLLDKVGASVQNSVAAAWTM